MLVEEVKLADVVEALVAEASCACALHHPAFTEDNHDRPIQHSPNVPHPALIISLPLSAKLPDTISDSALFTDRQLRPFPKTGLILDHLFLGLA